MTFINSIFLIAACIALLLLWYWRRSSSIPLDHVPSPIWVKVNPLYRALLFASGNGSRNVRELHARYGDAVRLGPNYVSFSHPDAVRTIYSSTHKFRKSPVYSNLGLTFEEKHIEIIMSTQDPTHFKKLRQSVVSRFSTQNIELLVPFAQECCDRFVDSMRQRNGQPITLYDWCQFFAFDLSFYVTFGRLHGFMEKGKDLNELLGGIDKGLDYLTIVCRAPFLHPYLLGNGRLLKVLEFFGLESPPDKLVKVAKHHMRDIQTEDKGSRQNSLLDWIYQDPEKRHLTNADIIGTMFTLATGGSTVASTLTYILHQLSLDQPLQSRLFNEISLTSPNDLAAIGSGQLKLPLLQGIIKEGLRLSAAEALHLERQVPAGGAEICGVFLPEGTLVGMPPSVIHANTDIYGKNTDKFQPERWMEASPTEFAAMDVHLLSFGQGIRTCTGKMLGYMEMYMFLVSVVRRFRIERADTGGVGRMDGLWHPKPAGAQIYMRERDDESKSERM